jgi:hypothetical protein
MLEGSVAKNAYDRHRTSALTEITFHRMRFAVKYCFAIDLVTAGAAGHEYPKQRLQNNAHRICLIKLFLWAGISIKTFHSSKIEESNCARECPRFYLQTLERYDI